MLFSFRGCRATHQLAPPRKRLRELRVPRGAVEECVARAALQELEHSREFDRKGPPAKGARGARRSARTFLEGWLAAKFSQVPTAFARGQRFVRSAVESGDLRTRRRDDGPRQGHNGENRPRQNDHDSKDN